jgi:hypothetical protein
MRCGACCCRCQPSAPLRILTVLVPPPRRGGDTPRACFDLGSHASHGAYVNVSDALLFLDRFHARGSLVVAVDAFEDFALDLARRMEHNEPCTASGP